jgi:hypothetical protein
MQSAQSVVLTVQAASASGSQGIIHSGQVVVRIPEGKGY